MKHKLFYLLALTIILVGFIAVPVSAHTFKSDGSNEVVLHTDPNDNPISGTPSAVIFYIADTTEKFSLSECSCRLTVLENGKTITHQALLMAGPGYTKNPYTFPNPDVYTIQISGQPKVANAFQPFQLSYLVRVEPNVNNTSGNSRWRLIWIGLGAMMTGIVLIALYQDYTYRRDHKKDKESE